MGGDHEDTPMVVSTLLFVAGVMTLLHTLFGSRLPFIHGLFFCFLGKSREGFWFPPFTSLYPLVVACSKNGFENLDSVYFQLETLSHADPPYKSVAAVNCIILGCANTWDLNRAYQTIKSISFTFRLTPDTHSYNALMYAFGKLKMIGEASKVFEHLISLGVKPNATWYSLLADAHLIKQDPKASLSVIEEMENTGFVPSEEILKKTRR